MGSSLPAWSRLRGTIRAGAAPIPDHASPIARHTYNTIVRLPLPVDQRGWLLAALHRRAGQPAPPEGLVEAMVRRGPIRALRQLRAIPGFGRRRQRALRRVLTAADLSDGLAALLADLTDRAPASFIGPVQLAHPFGPDAAFPPIVARILGKEGLPLYGTARPLPGLAFSDRIVDFRTATKHPAPKEAVVIGGGYVGAEVALLWALAGCRVTLLHAGPALLVGYDEEAVAEVCARLEAAGVCLMLETAAAGWREAGDGKVAVVAVREEEEVVLQADRVLVAVGLVYTG